MNITGDIKWYFGEGDYAQLKFSESATSFSIDIVMVPAIHRKKGIGTILINHILVLADSMKKDLFVSARPFGPFSTEKLDRLVGYYSRFGFEITDKGLNTVYMVRTKR